MGKREFICIVCPMGCNLEITIGDQIEVTGNSCPRGAVYAKQEIVAPKRNISSSVRVKNGFLKLCPVKTKEEIPKEMIFDVMAEINKVELEAPIKLGQVIIANVLNIGVDIVASRDISRV